MSNAAGEFVPGTTTRTLNRERPLSDTGELAPLSCLPTNVEPIG